MIDLTQETLISLRDVPKRLPPRSNGKRLHISAVYRWLLRGVRGHRLESIRIGGTTYTSEEALQRFADRLSQPRTSPSSNIAVSTLSRQREIDRAAREVEKIYGKPKH